MEQHLHIPTDDGHQIYGVLNGGSEEKLIIFVHGLTGNMNEHQFYNAARFFPEHGFSTFRFNLYSGKGDARTLTDCSLDTHVQDLNAVIAYFTDSYQYLYLVGHSFGGPAILYTDTKSVTSIVLWDPSYDPLAYLGDEIQYNEQLGQYILSWENEYIISSEMYDSWKQCGEKLLALFSTPTKIICAGQDVLYKDWKNNSAHLPPETELALIKDAGHCFDEEGAEEQLFQETLNWFTL